MFIAALFLRCGKGTGIYEHKKREKDGREAASQIRALSYYKQEFFSRYEVEGDDWYDWKQEVVTRLQRTPVYNGGMYVHGTSKLTFKCKGRG